MALLDEIIDKALLANKPDSSKEPNNALMISALLEPEGSLIDIEYPDDNDAWVYRNDCGSHSQHRWSLYSKGKEVAQLVCKHNACGKAIFLQKLCRNCSNPEWRKTCLTPQNIFYVFLLQENMYDTMKPLIFKKVCLTYDQLDEYRVKKPRVVNKMRRDTTDAKIKQRIVKLCRNVRSHVEDANRIAELIERNSQGGYGQLPPLAQALAVQENPPFLESDPQAAEVPPNLGMLCEACDL
tara:strand:- start:440 stop:1156 length:717 start_codon:yes stop_codon:yes gene_type:complete